MVGLSLKREGNSAEEGYYGADSQMGARRRGLLLGGWSYGCWQVLP